MAQQWLIYKSFYKLLALNEVKRSDVCKNKVANEFLVNFLRNEERGAHVRDKKFRVSNEPHQRYLLYKKQILDTIKSIEMLVSHNYYVNNIKQFNIMSESYIKTLYKFINEEYHFDQPDSLEQFIEHIIEEAMIDKCYKRSLFQQLVNTENVEKILKEVATNIWNNHRIEKN
jgi:hypothetical protein